MPEPVFFQHFRVEQTPEGGLRELGRGAMGITYKAFDTNLHCPVALKIINSALTGNEHARERFLREARAAARLRHPNVATVLHLGKDDQSFFYAMEFIEGETLEAFVARRGPLAPALALEIVQQVARALGAAQNEGLVHRDIKPANLMLARHHGEEDEEGVHVKVIDFGLAKFIDKSGGNTGSLSLNLTMAGGFVGSPYFASPEQVDEGEIDTRSDLYSLGATLWFLLAGEPPFTGSLGQVLAQHLQRTPPFEKLEARGVPAPVVALLRRLLAKSPDDRPADPAVLRREVAACLRALGAPVGSDTAATLSNSIVTRELREAAHAVVLPVVPPPLPTLASAAVTMAPPPLVVPPQISVARMAPAAAGAAPAKSFPWKSCFLAGGLIAVPLAIVVAVIVWIVQSVQHNPRNRVTITAGSDELDKLGRQIEQLKKLDRSGERPDQKDPDDEESPTPAVEISTPRHTPAPPASPPPTPYPTPPPVVSSALPPASNRPPWVSPVMPNGVRAITSYQARLSARDHRSSSGEPLNSIPDILRQDRANYHRFNARDPEDEGDPLFADARQRSRFDSLTFHGGGREVIVNGTPLVQVDVYPNRVIVSILAR